MKNKDPLLVKTVTVLLHSALAFLVLATVVGMVLPMMINPNNYKEQIANHVFNKTGRKLHFAGDIRLELFPDIKLNIEKVSLGNADGFGDQPFAYIEVLDVTLKLWPLLKRAFVIKRFSAEGVEVFLQEDKKGANNWDDLIHKTSPNSSSPKKSFTPSLSKLSAVQFGTASMAALSLGGGTLKNSTIQWKDQKGNLFKASSLDISMGSVQKNHPIDVSLQSKLTLTKPHFQGKVALDYRLHPLSNDGIFRINGVHLVLQGESDTPPLQELNFDWHSDIQLQTSPRRMVLKNTNATLTAWSSNSRFREVFLGLRGQLDLDFVRSTLFFPNGTMVWKIKANNLPPAGVTLAFQSDTQLDWNRESVTMDNLKISGPAQLELKGTLKGERLFSQPEITSTLVANTFDPKAMLVALGQRVPATFDPKALSKADFSASIHLDSLRLAVTDFTMRLDDSNVNGNVQLSTLKQNRFDNPIIRFDLKGDQFNLDRYLPPEPQMDEHHTEGDSSQKPHGKLALSIAKGLGFPEILLSSVDRDSLNQLDLHGKLSIQQVQVAHTHASNLSMDVMIQDNQVKLSPYRLHLYEGILTTVGYLDARQKERFISVDKTVTDLQTESLLKELNNTTWISGVASGTAHLKTHGEDSDSLKKNLSGTLILSLKEGQIQGMDVVQRIRNNYVAIKGRKDLPDTPKQGVTHFSTLSATGTLKKGVLSNQDLLAESPTIKITGNGWVDFIQKTVDYSMEADVLTSLQGLDIQNLEKLRGLTLPIHIKGPFSDIKSPSVNSVDFSRMLRSVISTPMLQKTIDKLGGEQKVREKLDKFEQKLGGKGAVNDLLKQLLGL